ncbi:unnamed protein product [Ambrosiozyma monospora]|uniref:Unnamed protein product n=1 Tax=Ambrosiozyma monospora TaxID=43982 RepID=A0A9W6Z058_AMBMO|nr:unnamed protein product [Ambrosiozyma monospora]
MFHPKHFLNYTRPKLSPDSQKYVDFVTDLPIELRRLFIAFALTLIDDCHYENYQIYPDYGVFENNIDVIISYAFKNTTKTTFFESAIAFVTPTPIMDIIVKPGTKVFREDPGPQFDICLYVSVGDEFPRITWLKKNGFLHYDSLVKSIPLNFKLRNLTFSDDPNVSVFVDYLLEHFEPEQVSCVSKSKLPYLTVPQVKSMVNCECDIGEFTGQIMTSFTYDRFPFDKLKLIILHTPELNPVLDERIDFFPLLKPILDTCLTLVKRVVIYINCRSSYRIVKELSNLYGNRVDFKMRNLGYELFESDDVVANVEYGSLAGQGLIYDFDGENKCASIDKDLTIKYPTAPEIFRFSAEDPRTLCFRSQALISQKIRSLEIYPKSYNIDLKGLPNLKSLRFKGKVMDLTTLISIPPSVRVLAFEMDSKLYKKRISLPERLQSLECRFSMLKWFNFKKCSHLRHLVILFYMSHMATERSYEWKCIPKTVDNIVLSRLEPPYDC